MEKVQIWNYTNYEKLTRSSGDGTAHKSLMEKLLHDWSMLVDFLKLELVDGSINNSDDDNQLRGILLLE